MMVVRIFMTQQSEWAFPFENQQHYSFDENQSYTNPNQHIYPIKYSGKKYVQNGGNENRPYRRVDKFYQNEF